MAIFFFNFNVYLFLRQRETEHEQGWGRERGRHRTEGRLQALSHQPRARRGARTHGPRDRDLRWSRTLNRLSHSGAPHCSILMRARSRRKGCHGNWGTWLCSLSDHATSGYCPEWWTCFKSWLSQLLARCVQADPLLSLGIHFLNCNKRRWISSSQF